MSVPRESFRPTAAPGITKKKTLIFVPPWSLLLLFATNPSFRLLSALIEKNSEGPPPLKTLVNTMRFSASVLLYLSATGSVASAFAPAVVAFRPKTTSSSFSLHQSTTPAEVETADEQQRKSTKKDERLRMMKSDQFHRMGFKEVRQEVEGRMQQEFQSQLVGELKSNNYVMERDGVKVYLAKVRR
jgi:hypothetical protein